MESKTDFHREEGVDVKKAPKIQAVLVAVLLAAVGCQSQQQQPNQSIQDSKDLTVIKVIAESPEAIVPFQNEEEAIAKKFGVRLEYTYPKRITDQMEDFLFASKETYDIYTLFPAKMPEYVERKLLLPLDRYTANNSELEDIVPVYRKMYMKYAGHDYGMVYDGDAHLLYYRKDIFDQFASEYKQKFGKELHPPKTWQEYDQIAQFLTRDLNGDGKNEIYGTALLGSEGKRYIPFAERYLAMGGRYFDENMHPLIQTDKGVQALEDLIRLAESKSVSPQSMYDWVDLNNVFLQGKIAMVIQWSDTARFTYDQKNWHSQVANKVGWALVPGGDKDSPRGGTWIGRVLAISSQSTHPDQAWQVIQHVTSKEVSKKSVTSYDTINDPYRVNHFVADGKGPFPTKEINQDFLQTLYASLKNTNTDLMIPGGWEYMQVLDKNIGLAFIHKVTAQEALQTTAEEWEGITERYSRAAQKEYYRKWLEKLNEVKLDEGY